jgi:hypothetical protein
MRLEFRNSDDEDVVYGMVACADSLKLLMPKCTFELEVVYNTRGSGELFLHEMEVLLAAKYRILSELH